MNRIDKVAELCLVLKTRWQLINKMLWWKLLFPLPLHDFFSLKNKTPKISTSSLPVISQMQKLHPGTCNSYMKLLVLLNVRIL